jgi:polyhydroxyalkanoate synthesis regulator phasin
MILDDLRKTLEAAIGTLTPTRAQQIAKDALEPGAAKEQVAKTAADLLEWSQASRERLSAFVRREISDQLTSVGGVATQAELNALKKRVRDLERASSEASARSSSPRSKTKGSQAARTSKPATARTSATSKRRSTTKASTGSRSAARAPRGSASSSG